MKKVIILILLSLVLVGCGSSEKNMLEKIKEKGSITVAVSPDYAPYEFIDPTKSGEDKYVGSDIELAKYIASELEVELVLVPMAFSDIAGAITLQQYDLGISGFTYDEERAQAVTFSKAYDHTEASCQSILVPKDKVNDYKTLADFNGKSLAAQNGSIQQNLVTNQIENANIQLITEINDGVLELNAGNVDGLAIACSTAPAITEANSHLVLSSVYFEVEGEDGTMVIMPNDQPQLLEKVNEIIEKSNQEGLYTKWMSDAIELAKTLGVE